MKKYELYAKVKDIRKKLLDSTRTYTSSESPDKDVYLASLDEISVGITNLRSELSSANAEQKLV